MSFDELESRVEKVVSWMSHTLVLVREINEGTRDLLDKETVYEETELAYRTLLDTTTGLLVILESMIQCLEFEHDEEGEEPKPVFDHWHIFPEFVSMEKRIGGGWWKLYHSNGSEFEIFHENHFGPGFFPDVPIGTVIHRPTEGEP